MTASIVKQTGSLVGRLSTTQTLAGKLSTALPDGGYERGYEEGVTDGYTNMCEEFLGGEW